MSIETLRVEIEAILKAEGITVLYDVVQSKPGEFAEGEYRPGTKTVVIDQDLAGYPDEPLTIAHEIGHHFDLLQDGIHRHPQTNESGERMRSWFASPKSTNSESTPRGLPTITVRGPIPTDRRRE
jgi:hypothetical protein